MFVLDEELKEFVESGVAVVIGTAGVDRTPHAVMAWGPRVDDGGRRLTVFVEASRAADTLADLELTGRMAVTFGDPISYRSIQLKGYGKPTGKADDDEEAWIQRHRDRFQTATALVGDPPQTIRNLMMGDVMMRFEMAVERAFDQTPGPEAGREL